MTMAAAEGAARFTGETWRVVGRRLTSVEESKRTPPEVLEQVVEMFNRLRP